MSAPMPAGRGRAIVRRHEPDHPESHREIAFRAGDGIEVTLLWAPTDDRVVVAVVDTRANDAFEVPVEKHRALHAFTHPFAYAASVRRPPAASAATG